MEPNLDEFCQRLLTRLAGAEQQADDIAVVALRRLPAPVQRTIHRLDPLGSRRRAAPFAHTLLLIARA